MYKSIQRLRLSKSDRILVLHAPRSFEEFEQYFSTVIDREIRGRAYPCAFYFARDLSVISEEVTQVLRATAFDALFWFCFPKKGDKNHPRLTRESIGEFFSQHGLEPVAQRTIDEEWTALRIRPSELVSHRRKK